MICLRLGVLAKVNTIVPSVVRGWEGVKKKKGLGVSSVLERRNVKNNAL